MNAEINAREMPGHFFFLWTRELFVRRQLFDRVPKRPSRERREFNSLFLPKKAAIQLRS
jgi:hypothetical protein